MRLSHALNVNDVRTIARRKLPRAVFDIIDGGAEDECTLRANERAFQNLTFRPRLLTDVSRRDLSTTVLGTEVSMPILLDPTGASRVAHPHAELALARAAGRARTIYVQSTVTSYPLETVSAAAGGPLWFQLYVAQNHRDTAALIDRVEQAGYLALCVTLDSAVFGSRERDKRNGVARLRVTPRVALQGLRTPRWSFRFLRGNLHRQPPPLGGAISLSATRSAIVSSWYSVTWRDLEWIRGRWPHALVVKGVMAADDCARLLDLGIDALIVSNHGGRQLDSLPATIDVLAEVVDAVGDRAEVLIDGGIRRGSDVAKALAIGARACLIGRPYLYGLAAGGEDGVVSVLDLLRTELDRCLALLGCTSVAELDRRLLWPAPEFTIGEVRRTH